MTKSAHKVLQLDRLQETPLKKKPFPYLIVPQFLSPDSLDAIHKDYPDIQQSGSFPTDGLEFGSSFQNLLCELNGQEFRQIIETKFGIPLAGLPTITTVRGRCAQKDGAIHRDSVTKLITVLLYMNSKWEKPGGQLRLLNSDSNIEDFFCEIPPQEGTLLVFEVTPNSWHGHLPFEGERRVIQFNWLTSNFIAKKERIRHKISAKLKKIKRFFS